MEEIKRRFIDSVASRLTAAPRSAAKDELVEELSDNLYRRFLDMTGAGVPEEEAFARSLDDLGDVDELLRYLGVEPAGDVTIDQAEGQTRITTGDGQHITINSGDGEPIIINSSADEPAAGDAAQPQGGPQAQTDGRGDVHYDHSGQASQSDFDAIMAGVQEACNAAIDQARSAIQQAKEALKRRTTVEKDKGRVTVHFNTRPNGAPPEPPVPPTPPEPPAGWEFEAELDSDAGRFFAGAGPKEKKDVVYGFGYDKERGGFFTQWGEYQGQCPGPWFTGEDSEMHPNDDGSYSVTALKDLRGIEVITNSGDVTLHMSEAPDAGVIIGGDVDDLDVTCSAGGVLTIREGRTASSYFFSRRGFASADVELFLPCRLWESISVTTASGDVDVDREVLEVDRLSVKTANGDLTAHVRVRDQLTFHSASGDLDLKGACAALHAETMSGDISLEGEADTAVLRTASGDIELQGPVRCLRASTMSGDVQVETSRLPEEMDLSSKSGDCEARIPDAGPFTLRMKTVSGELGCAFPVNYIDGVCVYGDGSGPAYSMTSVSGDVSLERF